MCLRNIASIVSINLPKIKDFGIYHTYIDDSCCLFWGVLERRIGYIMDIRRNEGD